MFYFRLEATGPCAPQDCCPPKRIVYDVMNKEHTEIKRTRYYLDYCGNSFGLGIDITGPSLSASRDYCIHTQALGSITVGDASNFPDDPPRGKWVSPLFTITTPKPNRKQGCIPPTMICDGIVVETIETFRTRGYEYCE
jgi:hypothetical protein